ncbi:hypothetical protein GMJLKIPL_1954 [Methylobacterium isbiliense]|jgi:hypothetical protein|uniref:Uncharacterized protein n=1 Tax=Methylobacterium isbiliense TaxID=315478 RepID=A0ABQ4SEC7_9HYPH|nr:hypothetical protein GMJLKIPL_1954 [Methylobacterium isbiliense]
MRFGCGVPLPERDAARRVTLTSRVTVGPVPTARTGPARQTDHNGLDPRIRM